MVRIIDLKVMSTAHNQADLRDTRHRGCEYRHDTSAGSTALSLCVKQSNGWFAPAGPGVKLCALGREGGTYNTGMARRLYSLYHLLLSTIARTACVSSMPRHPGDLPTVYRLYVTVTVTVQGR